MGIGNRRIPELKGRRNIGKADVKLACESGI